MVPNFCSSFLDVHLGDSVQQSFEGDLVLPVVPPCIEDLVLHVGVDSALATTTPLFSYQDAVYDEECSFVAEDLHQVVEWEVSFGSISVEFVVPSLHVVIGSDWLTIHAPIRWNIARS